MRNLLGNAKPYLRYLGMALTLLGLAFLFHSLDWSSLGSAVGKVGVGNFLLGAFAYAGATLLLTAAWIGLLPRGTSRLCSKITLLKIHARSVGAKYIPGNVFHFATRQADLAAYQVPQLEIAKASLYEVVSLLCAAGLIVAYLGFRNDLEAVVQHAPDVFQSAITLIGGSWPYLALACSLTLGLFLAHRRPTRLISVLLHLGFFLCLEAIAQQIWQLLLPTGLNDSLPLGVITMAWFLGFITIGSPGGLGVRELVIILCAQVLFGPSATDTGAATALLLRFVTVAGDVLFVIAANLAPNSIKRRIG